MMWSLCACGNITRSIGEDETDSGSSSGRRNSPDEPGDAGAGAEVGEAGASSGGRSSSGVTSGSGGGPASGGSTAAVGGGPLGGPRSTLDFSGAPIYTRVQRLTHPQWERAVTDILRLAAPPDVARKFEEPVGGGAAFSNNERLLEVRTVLVSSYQHAAEEVAAMATGSAAAREALYDGTDASGFVEAFGRRAFRRPLTDDEQQRYEGIFTTGEALYGAGFANGAALVIRAMLQSPHFLYRTELGPAGGALDGYEIASKLSFALLGTTPSDALLDAAEKGELDDVKAVERYAREMLETTDAVAVMRDFHRQLYHLDRLPTLALDVTLFGGDLRTELEDASREFFDHIFREGLGFRQIVTTTEGFVGAYMAKVYDVNAPARGVALRELGPSRLGFFTQMPFLVMNGGAVDPRTVQRGMAIHRDVLCAEFEPPVPEAPSVPPPAPGETNRERYAMLTASCGGDCHNAFLNPLGFAFESFDGLGRERTEDNGQPVDASGTYPFADGTQTFANAGELMKMLADSPQANLCYSMKVASYGLQRDITKDDVPLLDSLADVSVRGSVKDVVLSLVTDPAFRMRPKAAK